jgi:ribosomal protein S18 acetylase RimI-like enzyme
MEPIVRTLRATDLAAVAEMLNRLSDTSRYRRFFSLGVGGSRRELAYLPSVDGHERVALVAEVGDRVVGLARYHVGESEDGRGVSADVAVVVEDAYQHRGLGRQLMIELARAARHQHVDAFEVSVLGDNAPAIRLLRRLAPHAGLGLDHGVYEATVPLAS